MHQSFLVERITPFDPAFQVSYQQLMAWLKAWHPEMASMNSALGLIYKEVVRQANMLAFNDAFWILACLTALLIPLTLLFRAPRASLGHAGMALHPAQTEGKGGPPQGLH